MQSYWLSCKKHTDSKKSNNAKNIIRQKSRCANCVAEKS